MQAKKRGKAGANCLREPLDSRSLRNKPDEVYYVLDRNEDDKRPFLTVRIFGSEVRALLDSGATQTILGSEGLWLMDRFPAFMKTCYGKVVQTADAKQHKVVGQAILPITLQGRTEQLPVLVVPSLQQNLILGVDFWDKMQIVADVHNQRWDFGPKKNSEWCCAVDGIQANDRLTEEERKKLLMIVDHHFKNEPTTLGRTDKVKLVIDTGDAQPIKQRYYPLSPARQQQVNEELDRMLELG